MGGEIWDSPNVGGGSPLCSQFQRRQRFSIFPDTSHQDTPNLPVPQLRFALSTVGRGGNLGEVKRGPVGPGLLNMEPEVSLGMECQLHTGHLGILPWMGVATAILSPSISSLLVQVQGKGWS